MALAQDTHGQRDRLWTRDFILMLLVNLFLYLGFTMLLPVLPVYSAKLGGTEAWAGIIVGIFSFSSVFMRPFAGWLLDQYGRKSVFIYGLLLFIICVFAFQWAPGIMFLLSLRLINGFSWGASSTASMTIGSDIIPKSRLGEGVGIFGLTSTLAMASGPAIGLGIMGKAGFGTVFNIAAAMVIVSMLVTIPVHCPKPTDIKGKLTLAGFIEKEAILPGVVMFLITMSYGAVVSFIALYAAQRQVENIGLFFTVYAIALLVSRPLFGRLADRKGYAYAVLPGLGAVLAALLMLYFTHTLGGFLVSGFIYGLGFGAAQPVLQAMAVAKVAPARRGAANGTFFVGFDLGIGIGSIIWGAIAEVTGYQTIYLLSMIPAVIAVGLFEAARYQRRKE